MFLCITLLTKIHIVKAMVFPGVMYRHKSWTIKKAECWRIDAFQLWGCRRLLSVPWTARSIKQVNLKGSQPWIFIRMTDGESPILWPWPSDAKSWCTGKDPDAGKDLRARGEEDNRGWDSWMASSSQWIWISANSRRQWRGSLECWQRVRWLSD